MKRLLLLTILVLALNPEFVLAEISSPYVVDEKEVVLFGDSTTIGEYEGLGNYTYEYVDGYLRIEFSYVHHQCCFASYPPALYITSHDPRSTTTLAVRENANIYPLQSQPAHLSEVYFYDVQFDSSGYTVIVTASSTEVANIHKDIAGVTNGDYVALANHYPRYDPVSQFSMSFTPVPIFEEVELAPTIATTTPVVIVPGIMGSKLEYDNNEVWLSLTQLTVSYTDEHLNALALPEDGSLPEGNEVVASEIVKSVNIPLFKRDHFLSLIENLAGNDQLEYEDLLPFPYDWRLSIRDSAQRLKNRIDEIKAESGVESVNIIAHSMGGLIVKKYIKEYGGNSISKFIDVATPHTGSPKSFQTLMYGDTDIAILNGSKIKEIIQNMPAVYQLLPSADYFDESDPNYRYYVFNGVNGNSRLGYEETKTYMTTNGRNELLVERADEFHQEIDGVNPEEYGVETYNFAGCGTPTIGQFYILDEEDGHYTYNIKMINGDGTVPLRSAEAMQARETFYVRNAQHAVMPSTTGVKELIANLLTSTSTEDIDISSYSNLSRTSHGCFVPNGKLVSFHSPIELHIYDSSGNHTGPNSDGDIENEIEGVVYEVIGGNKFAFLPEGAEYTVRGSATDVGSFDVRIQELVNGEVASTTIYADIPLTLTSQTNFVVSNDLPGSIPVDHESDDVFESSYPVSTTTSGLLETTGKVALVEIPMVVIDESQSSKSQFIRVENLTVSATTDEISVATTTEELYEISNFEIRDETETVSEISTPVEPEEELQIATTTEEVAKEGFENTAVVYKSVGYKLWERFYVFWVWILNLFS